MANILPDLKDWRFSVDREGIAWAVFDREGESVNTLGRRPLEELAAIVARTEEGVRTRDIRGLVLISGKKKGFIAGADIREFDALATEAQVLDALRPVNELFDRIEAMPVPVVAAIHGACAGGGLELALACHWRIATRDEATRVGFPEIKLGLFPGFNGTARAIRQAGALAAMENMLTGALIRAPLAKSQGFLDELVASPGTLRWAARKAVLKKRRSKPAGPPRSLARLWPARTALAARMRAKVREKVREDHYPAPYRLIDLFENHGGSDADLKVQESKAFAPLMVSETARNLFRVFRLSELLKAQAPKKGAGFKPLRAHVIGAGTMGAAIAGWCVASGMEVTLEDVAPGQIGPAIEGQSKLFARKFRTKAQRDAAKARFLPDPQRENLHRADVVIEAVAEKLEVKQRLFKEIEPRLKPGALLATNTSSLPIEEIAAHMSDPGRLIGLHFFNPVAQMPLVEVVRGAQSREEEVRRGAAFVIAIDKLPLIVRSGPGFLVNRILAPYMMGALARVERGEDKEKIDEAARTFGMPMGPVELADSVGLDICLHVGKILGHHADDSQLGRLVGSGRLGKKSGEGFYVWKDDKPKKTSTQEYSRGELDQLGRELIRPMIAEACRCLEEQVVESAGLIDAGAIFGFGFAPFRGGPLHYAATEEESPPDQAAAAE